MTSMTPLRFACMLLLAACAPSFSGDWNPKLAADYLDGRQKAWFEWQPAKATGGACMSCHTGAPYLLARPALRRALGEKQPTTWETNLLNGLRARAGMRNAEEMFQRFNKEPLASQSVGVESVFAALFLNQNDASRATLSEESQKAFDRLWSLQVSDGEASGAWRWFSLDLDPYETPPSVFYGAALAALAAGNAPEAYRKRSDVQEHLTALYAYFERQLDSQPLHNRLMLLWASTRLPDAMPEAARRSLIDAIWQTQQADGGWTIESLGPWKERGTTPVPAVSDAYASGLVAFVLGRAGVSQTDGRFARALGWLRSHQDKQGGYWSADSMNKKYPAGSMQELFMRDTATAFVALALVEASERAKE